MREKLLTFTVTIPTPENFTGRVLVSVEKWIVLGSYVLRKNEFTTTVESFLNSQKWRAPKLFILITNQHWLRKWEK